MNNVSGNHPSPVWRDRHASMRTDGYALLGALLTEPPSKEKIELVGTLWWQEDVSASLGQALAALARAGRLCSVEELAEEYHRLFVGLGRGELVPYASWYLEKTIQSQPLAAIRSDLARLGIIRQSDCSDSEDHAGALCEIMALLSSSENGSALAEQAEFFFSHLTPWIIEFFDDLENVSSSRFFRAVGAFGRDFLEDERKYLGAAVSDIAGKAAKKEENRLPGQSQPG